MVRRGTCCSMALESQGNAARQSRLLLGGVHAPLATDIGQLPADIVGGHWHWSIVGIGQLLAVLLGQWLNDVVWCIVPRVSSLDSVDEAAELDALPPAPGSLAQRHGDVPGFVAPRPGDALIAAGDCCDASVDHNWSFPDRALNIWKTLTPLAVSAAGSRARLAPLSEGGEGGALDAIAP